MALPASGQLSISDIATEFSDSQPNLMSDYYRGGAVVPDAAANGNVPVSGAISIGNFYNAANRTALALTISSSTQNYDVFSNASPSPLYAAGITDVTLTINPGVLVGSSATTTYAMSVPSGFNPGDTVTIINNGVVQGRGGNAGAGSTSPGVGGGGNPGGSALYVNRATTITNNGTFAGGGGGGGGGRGNTRYIPSGPPKSPSFSPSPLRGGGGGGGAGYPGGSGGAPNGGAGSSTGGGGGGAGASGPSSSPKGTTTVSAYPGGAGGGRGANGAGAPSGGAGGSTGRYATGNPLITWSTTGTRQGGVS